MKKRHSYDPNRLKFFLKVMKAYALLFVITLTRLAAFEASGQSISIDMQNVELSSILLKIEEKSEYRFFYSNNLIDVDTPYSLHVQDAEIEDVLEVLFDNKPIAYRFLDKQIVLFPENETQTSAHVDALINKEKAKPLDKIKGINRLAEQLQQRTVRGTVSDQEGLPLPGVSVVVKGTSRGVTTDFDGAFQIRVPDSGATLVFSYVGMDTQEVNIDQQTTITVRMMPKTGQLDEVILTGYQTLERERVTGSVSKLESEDLNRVVSESVASAIEATTAGVLIQNDPEGDPEITIRGVSTLTGRNAPLIVVDGFPVSSGEVQLDFTDSRISNTNFKNLSEFDEQVRGSFLGSLNPKDIKSITVLKDAAAASIWGVRSANGVIVIETFSGKGNVTDDVELRYTQDLTFGLSKPDLSDLYFMNADQMIELVKDGYSTNSIRLRADRNYDIADAIYRDLNNGDITQDQADSRLEALKEVDFESQFEKYFLRPERYERHSLSASGRTDRINYLLSLTYSEKERVENKNDEKEYLVRAALGIQDFLAPNFNLDFNYTTSFTERKLNHISINDYRTTPAYDAMVDGNGNLLPQYKSNNRAFPHQYEMYDEQGYLDWRYNLLREFRARDNKNENQLNRLQGTLSYQLNDNIRLSTQYQYERTTNFQENLRSLEVFDVRQQINTYTYFDSATEQLTLSFPKEANIKSASINLKSWVWRNSLNYDFKIGQKGKLSGIVGHEMQQSTGDYIRQDIWGIDPVSLIQIPLDYQTLQTSGLLAYHGFNQRSFITPYSQTKTDSRYLSGFANLGLTWDDTYDLSVSGRVDQTNFFGVDIDERTSPFWSVGGGWLISNETFLKDSNFIDHLKLRLTYGFNGNVASSEGSVLIASTESRRETGELVLDVGTLPNPSLSWERVGTTNIGLDFGILNHRLWGSFEFYQKKASDLFAVNVLNPTYSPSLFAFRPEVNQNVGEIVNNGVDIQLNGLAIDSNNFDWQTTLNFSWADSEVAKANTPSSLSPGTSAALLVPQISIYQEGEAADALFAYQYQGLDENGAPQVLDVNDEVATSFLEANLKKIPVGVVNPKYFGGWVNSFNYKNFNLSFTFSYQLGHMMRGPIGSSARNYYAVRQNFSRLLADRWRMPGDEERTDIPAVDRNSRTIFLYAFSDKNIDKADFVRLRYLSAGYTFPEEVFKESFIRGINLNLQFSNLWIWTANRWNLDPEFYGGNVTTSVRGYSPPVTATFSVNVNF